MLGCFGGGARVTTIVNMFWHGGPLPPYASFCIRSFLNRGHSVRLFSYERIDVPKGVIHADANHIAKRDVLRRYHTVAAFSDYFRYEILHREGGWWIDVDVVCLSDELPQARYAWAEEEPGVINGAILKFPKNDIAMGDLVAAAQELSGKTSKWGTIGPRLLSKFLGEFKPTDHAGSTSTFYPLHWLEAPLFLLPEYKSDILDRIKGATFLHLWSNVFKDLGVDINRGLLPDSLLHDFTTSDGLRTRASIRTRLKTRHAIKRYWRQSWVLDHWIKVFRTQRKPPNVRYKLF